MRAELSSLQLRLGYEFKTPALLEQALTHRSYSATHNERLEFLGDAVLNCAVARLLYEQYRDLPEGDLSRIRSSLVQQKGLHEIAQRLELGQCLLLGEGELRSGGIHRPSILADAVEAIVGAVFLDTHFEAAAAVIARFYQPVLASVNPDTVGKDAKTVLQEYLQSRYIALPMYSVIATRGAAHDQEFEVECAIPHLSIQVNGIGTSRRSAEQAAAELALVLVTQEARPEPEKKRKARKTRAHAMTKVAVLND